MAQLLTAAAQVRISILTYKFGLITQLCIYFKPLNIISTF